MKNEIRIDFSQWEPDESCVELSFVENDDNMDIFRFHDYCKRFAAAVGYTNSSIEKVFGETND